MSDKNVNPQTEINGDGNVVGNENSSIMAKVDRGSNVNTLLQITGEEVKVSIENKPSQKEDKPSQEKKLNDYLAEAVSDFEKRMYKFVDQPVAPPAEPYKHLLPFEITDAGIFFGRKTAGDDLYEAVLKDRLTVLHAESGTGKTSLLQAGLSPHLLRGDYLPVYARTYKDPVHAIKKSIVPLSSKISELELIEFLDQIRKHLSRTKELVIILDQFEEFFTLCLECEREKFIDSLHYWYTSKHEIENRRPIRFVIALRKDYLGYLDNFKKEIPQILDNRYLLEPMTPGEAKAAITMPIEELNRSERYAPALLDTLTGDLERGGVELPHLQIICTQLYDSAKTKNETVITLKTYENLGGVGGVLGRHLNEVVESLPSGRSIAWNVLNALATKGTKRVLKLDTLKAQIEVEENRLKEILDWLEYKRLLRRNSGEKTDEIGYELTHECLIEEINKRSGQTELEFNWAKELLTEGVENWFGLGIPISRDGLELLYKYRKGFRNPDDKTIKCVLHSALKTDFEVHGWAKWAGDTGEEFLLAAALKTPTDEKIRRSATRGLGKLWGSEEVTRLGSEENEIRLEAAEALGKLKDRRAIEPLIAALQDSDSLVCGAAAEALGEIGDLRAVERLIAELQDKESRLRSAAAEALGRLGDLCAVEPLIETLHKGYTTLRVKAAEALGELANSRAVEPLVTALQEKESRIRLAAAEALGKLKDHRAVEPLIAALQDEDTEVRRAAIEVLGKLRDRRVVKPLIAALQDNNVHQAVVEALKEIGTPEARAALKKKWWKLWRR